MGQPISPLVAQIITHNLTESQRITNYLIDNLTEQRDKAYAELNAIRTNVGELLTGPCMPMPQRIMLALYPGDEVIEMFREVRDES